MKRSARPSARSKAKPSSGAHRSLLWLGAVLLLTFVAYWPSLSNGFINWDDNWYVTENSLMTNPTLHGILTTNVGGNYHPLTMASLVLNYKISGMDAGSYHWLNLLLHLANTALVFLFVRMLSGGRLWTSVVTALFFGIHPMHVESVAWVTERKDVLFAFFYLLALITYVRYLDTKRWSWLLGTWIAFVLSCASKPAAVVLPLTLLAIDWFRRRPWRSGVWVEKIPFFAVSILAGLLTVKAQQTVGATAASALWSLPQRVLFACYGTVMYVVKLFVPFHLSAVYPLPSTAATRLRPEFYLAAGVLAVVLPALLYLCRRVRPVVFGIAFFFINIVLVLQVLTVGAALMAERYTYLPYIGILFALAWWLDEPAGNTRIPVKPIVAGIFLLLLPISLVQTWNRCRVWKDPETFWNDTIQKFPKQIVDAYYNRGNHYMRTGRLPQSLADFDQAVALNPGIQRIWYNRGLVLAEMNQNDSALVSFEHSLRIEPKNVDALNNRGAMKYRLGQLADAASDFTRAIELNPRYRDAYSNRAFACYDMKEYEKAAADRKKAIEVAPGNPANDEEYFWLGLSLQRLNRQREAAEALSEAIQTARPGSARLGRYHLSRAYSREALHDRAGAVSDVHEAQRLGEKVDPAFLRAIGG